MVVVYEDTEGMFEYVRREIGLREFCARTERVTVAIMSEEL